MITRYSKHAGDIYEKNLQKLNQTVFRLCKPSIVIMIFYEDKYLLKLIGYDISLFVANNQKINKIMIFYSNKFRLDEYDAK